MRIRVKRRILFSFPPQLSNHSMRIEPASRICAVEIGHDGRQIGLTRKEQKQNMLYTLQRPGNFAMSEPSSHSEISRYEQACDQAIAMCDGNLRSTIKALIMANEYLEAELNDLQAAASSDGAAAELPRTRSDAA